MLVVRDVLVVINLIYIFLLVRSYFLIDPNYFLDLLYVSVALPHLYELMLSAEDVSKTKQLVRLVE
jgi:hypothetical protein